MFPPAPEPGGSAAGAAPSTSAPSDLPRFEDALERLQQIVQQLETGNLGLELSLAQFEEGVRLLRLCGEFLDRAEQRIEILTGLRSDGSPVVAPFDSRATAAPEGPETPRPGKRRAPRKAASSDRPDPDADSGDASPGSPVPG